MCVHNMQDNRVKTTLGLHHAQQVHPPQHGLLLIMELVAVTIVLIFFVNVLVVDVLAEIVEQKQELLSILRQILQSQF